MPSLSIPLGYEITQIEESNNHTIKIRVPKTKFWVIGEKTDNLWDAYLVDPQNNYKEILRKGATTRSFSMFSNVILKTPFPYQGKKKQNSTIIKKFIKKITKKHGNSKSKRHINSKSK